MNNNDRAIITENIKDAIITLKYGTENDIITYIRKLIIDKHELQNKCMTYAINNGDMELLDKLCNEQINRE